MKPLQPLTAEEVERLRLILDPADVGSIAALFGRLPDPGDPASRSDQGEPNDAPLTHRFGSRALVNLAVVHLQDDTWKTGADQLNPRGRPVIARLGVRPALAWWQRVVEEAMRARSMTPPTPASPAATIEEASRWLAQLLPFILAQGWAPILARDLFVIADQLDQAVTGKRPFRPRCADCRQHLEPQDEATWWKCPGCGRDYTPRTGLGDLGRRQPPMTARAIGAVLQMSPGTIRTWKHRGLITRAGTDPHGRGLYYLADAKRILGRSAHAQTG
ncbi:MAG: hypothetical protein QM779_08220 [Propionicimonas sp.]|uniref:hypothetical protein n=1 Tax=Propionicimonas sp. TaxID=1955623 RepID=UPI003D0A9615